MFFFFYKNSKSNNPDFSSRSDGKEKNIFDLKASKIWELNWEQYQKFLSSKTLLPSGPG